MADGVCWMQKRQVEDGHVCLAFSRKTEPEPPAPPVKPVFLDLPAETVAAEERPRVTGRPRFSFHAFLKDLLGINRLGALSMSNNFPHPNGRGEVKNNITNERNTK